MTGAENVEGEAKNVESEMTAAQNVESETQFRPAWFDQTAPPPPPPPSPPPAPPPAPENQRSAVTDNSRGSMNENCR